MMSRVFEESNSQDSGSVFTYFEKYTNDELLKRDGQGKLALQIALENVDDVLATRIIERLKPIELNGCFIDLLNSCIGLQKPSMVIEALLSRAGKVNLFLSLKEAVQSDYQDAADAIMKRMNGEHLKSSRVFKELVFDVRSVKMFLFLLYI